MPPDLTSYKSPPGREVPQAAVDLGSQPEGHLWVCDAVISGSQSQMYDFY